MFKEGYLRLNGNDLFVLMEFTINFEKIWGAIFLETRFLTYNFIGINLKLETYISAENSDAIVPKTARVEIRQSLLTTFMCVLYTVVGVWKARMQMEWFYVFRQISPLARAVRKNSNRNMALHHNNCNIKSSNVKWH